MTAQQQELQQGRHRWVFREEDTANGFASRKMLLQELLGCTLYNPTNTEHCLVHQFIGVKKEHYGTQRFFFLGDRVTVVRAYTTNQSCKLQISLYNMGILQEYIVVTQRHTGMHRHVHSPNRLWVNKRANFSLVCALRNTGKAKTSNLRFCACQLVRDRLLKY